jgi:hypothetical protein
MLTCNKENNWVLDNGINDSMYTEPLCEKLRRKHLICPAELDNYTTEGLQSYLGQQNFLQHVITSKMIHR